MIYRNRLLLSLVLANLSGLSGLLAAQTMDVLPTNPSSTYLTLHCPGSFPTDLTIDTCTYKVSQRAHDFVSSSVTDLAFLEAIVTGSFAQAIRSPGEWPGNWGNFGKRVGVRYNQSVAKGAAIFLVGIIDKEDPRHVSFGEDPKVPPGTQATTMRRVGHAFLDSVSDRRSDPSGNGKRWPAVTRFAGAYASGYGGYAWNPGPENTFKNASLRAAQSLGTDVGMSFYTEFSGEITRGLGAVIKLFSNRNSKQ